MPEPCLNCGRFHKDCDHRTPCVPCRIKHATEKAEMRAIEEEREFTIDEETDLIASFLQP